MHKCSKYLVSINACVKTVQKISEWILVFLFFLFAVICLSFSISSWSEVLTEFCSCWFLSSFTFFLHMHLFLSWGLQCWRARQLHRTHSSWSCSHCSHTYCHTGLLYWKEKKRWLWTIQLNFEFVFWLLWLLTWFCLISPPNSVCYVKVCQYVGAFWLFYFFFSSAFLVSDSFVMWFVNRFNVISSFWYVASKCSQVRYILV